MAYRSRGTVASKAISPARSRIKSKNGWIIHLRASHLQGALGDVKSFLTPRWFPVFFHHKRTSAASRRDRIFSRLRVFIHVLAFLYKALSPSLLFSAPPTSPPPIFKGQSHGSLLDPAFSSSSRPGYTFGSTPPFRSALHLAPVRHWFGVITVCVPPFPVYL